MNLGMQNYFKKIVIHFLLTAFIFGTNFSLCHAEPLSLSEIIEEAKLNNPEILAAAKRYEAAKARIPQAKSLDDPVFGVAFEKTPKNPFNFRATPSDERKFSVSQMFPFFGKLPLKGKIALVESQVYAADYKDKQVEIINAVKNAYYDLFMNYKEAELKRQSLELLKDVAATAEAKYSVGDIKQEEVFKIHSEIAKFANAIANLEENQAAKITRINTLLNRKPDSALGVPVLSDDISFSMDAESLYRLTLENRPELLIFAYSIEKNKYAKDLAKKSYFPDFIAGIVMRGLTAGTIGPWDLMMSFTVPLWFWTKQRYQVKEAIASLEEAEAAYAAMKNKALAQTRELYAKIEMAKNTVNLYKYSQMPILESSINSSLAGYRAGKGDIMMLLDSERMLIETKMNYYAALVDYNTNLSDLERAIGIDLKPGQRSEK